MSIIGLGGIGAVKKQQAIPKAVIDRIKEINSLMPKINNLDEVVTTYAGGTWPYYIVLTKPIEIKGKYVYIHSKQSSGYLPLEKRYNTGLRDYDNRADIYGLPALKYDLGIISKAYKNALK